MSEEFPTDTLSRRRRQLLRQGDSGRVGPAQAEGGGDAGGGDPSGGDPGGRRAGNLIDGRFRLLGRLGSGRLGEIYEARIDAGPESSVERLVALQLFDRRIAGDLALIDKLRRGYAALRSGPHRNAVRLDELGRDSKTWYLVMERLEGASLRFIIDDAGALPVHEAMPIVRSVGDALSYLHAKGMVHGAVTPSAVFVTEDYEVKLLDIVPTLPPSGLPAESVPDSRKASAPDPADDVFGLACLTYELLTGRHPYNYATDAEARRLGLRPAVIDQLSPVRWQALARGLATAREERTASVAVLLLDLGVSGAERLRASERPSGSERPTGSEPPPLPVRAAKPGDREAPLITTARDRLAIAPPPEPRRGGWFWPAFGAAVVGFLAAIVWVYQIPIRDVVVERLTAVGIDVIAGGEVARVDVSAAPETIPDADGAARAEAIPESTVAEETEIAPEQQIGAPPVTPEPEAQPVTPDTRIDVESRGAAEADLSADSSAAEPPEPSRFTFAEGPFRAQEGGSAAAITVNREGGIGSRVTIVWWTTGDTARAGEDYADLGQQTEVFEPGVESLTFHVPLVDDGLSEPPEGFLVSIGQPNPGSGRVDPSATTGVIIQDDDNSPR